jgi:hypothetical protein
VGYSHYWYWLDRVDEARMGACLTEVAAVLDAAAVPLAGPLGSGDPVRSSVGIACNGVAPDDYETFEFPGLLPSGPIRYEDGSRRDGFNCVKTAWMPYDEVVTACLLVAAHHFPQHVFRLSSDGEYPTDWQRGRALYERATGRSAPVDPFAPR